MVETMDERYGADPSLRIQDIQDIQWIEISRAVDLVVSLLFR
jgi:hypothetical protein